MTVPRVTSPPAVRHCPQVFLVLPVIFTVILVFLLVLPATQNPSDMGVGIALISSGLPVYYFTIHRKDIAGKFTRLLGKCPSVCVSLGVSKRGTAEWVSVLKRVR